jgi:hypothetical protein
LLPPPAGIRQNSVAAIEKMSPAEDPEDATKWFWVINHTIFDEREEIVYPAAVPTVQVLLEAVQRNSCWLPPYSGDARGYRWFFGEEWQ